MAVNKVKKIVELARNKRILDLGFLNHTLEGFGASPLHNELARVGYEIVGVDKNVPVEGNHIEWLKGDVTRVLPMGLLQSKYYDLIVAADLIEHLDNFAGFFENCNFFLRREGRLVVTTPNPFYLDLFLFTWLKNRVLINPEHTCWICPSGMGQLVSRHGFEIEEFHWTEGGWNLMAFILEGRNCRYDHLISKWKGKVLNNFFRKVLRVVLGVIWAFMRYFLTILSPINRYSGYMVICKKGD